MCFHVSVRRGMGDKAQIQIPISFSHTFYTNNDFRDEIQVSTLFGQLR